MIIIDCNKLIEVTTLFHLGIAHNIMMKLGCINYHKNISGQAPSVAKKVLK